MRRKREKHFEICNRQMDLKYGNKCVSTKTRREIGHSRVAISYRKWVVMWSNIQFTKISSDWTIKGLEDRENLWSDYQIIKSYDDRLIDPSNDRTIKPWFNQTIDLWNGHMIKSSHNRTIKQLNNEAIKTLHI